MSSTEGVKSACVPCSVGHFSTSSKLLNEAVRFAKDGLTSPQVLEDLASALGEQNALERIDLTPARIDTLPDWEKPLAEEALEKSRELRHRIESVQNIDELRSIAVDTENYFKHLNHEYASLRLEKGVTCPIRSEQNEAETENEPEPTKKAQSYQYGSKVSEARQKLFDEIHQARHIKN